MFSKIFITIAIFGLAQSAVNPVAPVLVRNEENPDPNYSYAYDVQDTVTGDSKNHLENRNGNVVTGQYSLNDPDGTRRTVQYTADPINGFLAFVKKEPLIQAQLVTVPQQQAALIQPQQAALLQQQPTAAIQEPVSFFQQPVSLIRERIYYAQPVEQPARLVQKQPARVAQKLKSQRQTAPQEVETTTINSDSEDIEPTTTEPTAASGGGYYYPKPASPAALFAKKQPLTSRKAPNTQPKMDRTSGKLEEFPEEPLAEPVNPIIATKPVQSVVAVEQLGRVATPVLNAPYIQSPYYAFSSPYTFSAVTVF